MSPCPHNFYCWSQWNLADLATDQWHQIQMLKALVAEYRVALCKTSKSGADTVPTSTGGGGHVHAA